jgi:vanillate O-demethylase ferredoxin subunit
MHEELATGSRLLASAPRNHFELVDDAPALLFAGGIGITPLIAMAEQLKREGRGFSLHYCNRSRSRAAFMDRLQSTSYVDHVHFHFDDEHASQRLDVAAVLAQATPAHHLYVCGPGGFIQHVLEAARQAGWDGSRVHREFFSAPVAGTSLGADGCFEVELASNGRKLEIPAGKSALAVLLDAGIDVPSSCETGVCGTCVTRVLEGTPDHRDIYLTDEERARNDCFTPCCSRARSPRLVLDL